MIRTSNLTLSVSRNAGGLYESVRRLVQSLAEQQMEVHVYGIRDEFTDEDLSAWKPAVVSAYQPTWPRQFGYSRAFLRDLTAFKPDIVHTHGIWVYPSIAANAYCRRERKPFVISAHGMLDPWAVRNAYWKKIIAYWLYERAHLRNAQVLRALCESEARAIRAFGLKNEIAIIPNGIDAPAHRISEPPPWADYVDKGRKVLLFLSRIHPKKGVANLLEAWASVRASASGTAAAQDWVLALAGWDQGGHERQLKERATELGIAWADIRDSRAGAPSKEPSLLFLGPQFGAGKAVCYQECDGFILPSFSEGVPMVALEAWVHRKPALLTPQCNLPEGFARGAALKIDPEAGSIARGLDEFFGMTDAERAAVGKRGYALARERFSWNIIAAQMDALYQWVLGGGQKPACLADY